MGKRALKLESPDPGALEDLLASGQSLKLLTRPDLMDGADPRERALYEQREREDVRRRHAEDALKRREMFVAHDFKRDGCSTHRAVSKCSHSITGDWFQYALPGHRFPQLDA